METCKYGSGADKRKPTAVKRKGVVYRAYLQFINRLNLLEKEKQHQNIL